MRVVLRVVPALMLLTAPANAFSLLGPYTDWMQFTNGYRQSDDIGGPMDLGEEYRWTVPVLTYAFDQSFLDYFGSNGVAAVEQAIQILNDLPPASEITVTNFPLDSTRYKYVAQALNLYDLKSAALSVLLEQMGLAEPTRHVFDLRRWNALLYPSDETTWWPGVIPYYIVERNFDPEDPVASHWVNDVLLTGYVEQFIFGYESVQNDVVEVPVDPLAVPYTAVADRKWHSGKHFTGLTRDDVGGLRYILGTNNWNLEALLPGVHGIGINDGNFVNQAVRPGADKVTFVRRDFDSLLGQFFPPFTNQFTDTYITNNNLAQQQLERVVTEPDFLFCASNLSHGNGPGPLVVRTGTTNWCNSGSPDFAGPGVIHPPIKITFNRLGPGASVYTYDSAPNGPAEVVDHHWGSFDQSTNAPVLYPNGVQPTTNRLTVSFWLQDRYAMAQNVFTWNLPVALGGQVNLLAATNLTDWVLQYSVTNRGVPVTWHHARSLEQRFFRVVPD